MGGDACISKEKEKGKLSHRIYQKKENEMKKREKKEDYSAWNHLNYLLRGIWNSDRKLMALMLLEMISIVITPYIAMYLPKIGVDLVAQQGEPREVVCILGGLALVLMVTQAVGNMAVRGKSVRQDRLRSHYRNLLFCKTLDCDYEHVESAEWQNQYHEAKEMSVNWGMWSATTLLSEGAVKVFGALISFWLYGRIIGTLSIWVLLMVIVLSEVNFAVLRTAQKYEVKRIGERSVLQTSRAYMKNCSCDVRFGKDIRLYEMAGWIRSCFAHYNEAHFRLRREVQRRYFGAAYRCGLPHSEYRQGWSGDFGRGGAENRAGACSVQRCAGCHTG